MLEISILSTAENFLARCARIFGYWMLQIEMLSTAEKSFVCRAREVLAFLKKKVINFFTADPPDTPLENFFMTPPRSQSL